MNQHLKTYRVGFFTTEANEMHQQRMLVIHAKDEHEALRLMESHFILSDIKATSHMIIEVSKQPFCCEMRRD